MYDSRRKYWTGPLPILSIFWFAASLFRFFCLRFSFFILLNAKQWIPISNRFGRIVFKFLPVVKHVLQAFASLVISPVLPGHQIPLLRGNKEVGTVSEFAFSKRLGKTIGLPDLGGDVKRVAPVDLPQPRVLRAPTVIHGHGPLRQRMNLLLARNISAHKKRR